MLVEEEENISRHIDLDKEAHKSLLSNKVIDLNFKNKKIRLNQSLTLENETNYNLNKVRLGFFKCLRSSDANVLFSFLKRVKQCNCLIVDISYNELSSNNILELASSISQIQNLSELQVGLGLNQQTDYSGLQKLFDTLLEFNKLQQLSFLLYYMNLKNEQVQYLSSRLKQLSNITQLDIRFNYNMLTDQSIIALSQAISSLNQLQKLFLGYWQNDLSDAGFCALFENLFQSSQNLLQVDLQLKVNQNKIRENDLIIQNKNQALNKLAIQFQNSNLKYFLVFQNLPQIEDLVIEFEQTELSEQAFQQVSSVINQCSKSSSFNKLNLCIPLKSQKVDQFSKSLSLCNQLQSLSLKCTQQSGMKEFLQQFSIKEFSELNLKELKFALECQFNNELICFLSQALSTQQNLINLNLQLINDKLNEVVDFELTSLFDYLQSLEYLKVLSLQIKCFNQLPNTGQIIGSSISQIKTLEQLDLDLSNNKLNEIGVKQIIDSLSALKDLQKLKIKLSSNPIQLEDLGRTTQGFSYLDNLKELFFILDLNDTYDQHDILFDLANNLKKNSKLQYLQINLFGFEFPDTKALRAIKKIISLVEYIILF
ncbi:hypothetical protein ABPG74_018565 [Tetrahymena malaccensis]